ncbi:MAG TPA: potassium transporter TrkA [Firmicutes bacterium]|nr:potassium transporter TrkA [Bacillota bacterium]
MRIIIAGGGHQADYLVKIFKEEKQDIVVINRDRAMAEFISSSNGVRVLNSDPTKIYSLSDARIHGADVMIALSENDADNYVICLIANRLFGVKKCVCVVSNPKNVSLFKRLGIDSVISSTYLIGQTIKHESSLEKLIRTLTIEEDKIEVIEMSVMGDFDIVGRSLKETHFPKNINISCILRDSDVIIPEGSTVINEGDKMIVITKTNEQTEIINFLKKKRNGK